MTKKPICMLVVTFYNMHVHTVCNRRYTYASENTRFVSQILCKKQNDIIISNVSHMEFYGSEYVLKLTSFFFVQYDENYAL